MNNFKFLKLRNQNLEKGVHCHAQKVELFFKYSLSVYS